MYMLHHIKFNRKPDDIFWTIPIQYFIFRERVFAFKKFPVNVFYSLKGNWL